MTITSFAPVPWLTGELQRLLPPAQAERLTAQCLAQLGCSPEDVRPTELVFLLALTLRALKHSSGQSQLDDWTAQLLLNLGAQLSSGQPTPLPRRSVEQHSLDIARAHLDLAERNLAAVQVQPTLQALEQAAGWEVEAARAEVRRWETALLMNDLRTAHAEQELADQLAAVREQEGLYLTHIRELERLARPTPAQAQQLDHARLMANQARHFVKRFTPLVTADADLPLMLPELPSESLIAEGVARHPEVLRRRFDWQMAEWHSEQAAGAADLSELLRELDLAKAAAQRQLRVLISTQSERERLTELLRQEQAQLDFMPKLAPGSAQHAQLRAEWRQLRSAARVLVHQLQEQYTLFRCLVGAADLAA